MENIKDRYVSYDNIDCYKDSANVLDALFQLFKEKPESKNSFWQKFETLIPENYHEVNSKEKQKDILYHVCANVFYISDLFEEYEFEKGIKLLDSVEYDCC